MNACCTSSIVRRRRSCIASVSRRVALECLHQIGVDLVQPLPQRIEESADGGDRQRDRDSRHARRTAWRPRARAARGATRLLERLAQTSAAFQPLAGLGLQLGTEASERLQLVELGVQQLQIAGQAAAGSAGCALPPTRETLRPTSTAGRSPSLNSRVSR